MLKQKEQLFFGSLDIEKSFALLWDDIPTSMKLCFGKLKMTWTPISMFYLLFGSRFCLSLWLVAIFKQNNTTVTILLSLEMQLNYTGSKNKRWFPLALMERSNVPFSFCRRVFAPVNISRDIINSHSRGHVGNATAQWQTHTGNASLLDPSPSRTRHAWRSKRQHLLYISMTCCLLSQWSL